MSQCFKRVTTDAHDPTQTQTTVPTNSGGRAEIAAAPRRGLLGHSVAGPFEAATGFEQQQEMAQAEKKDRTASRVGLDPTVPGSRSHAADIDIGIGPELSDEPPSWEKNVWKKGEPQRKRPAAADESGSQLDRLNVEFLKQLLDDTLEQMVTGKLAEMVIDMQEPSGPAIGHKKTLDAAVAAVEQRADVLDEKIARFQGRLVALEEAQDPRYKTQRRMQHGDISDDAPGPPDAHAETAHIIKRNVTRLVRRLASSTCSSSPSTTCEMEDLSSRTAAITAGNRTPLRQLTRTRSPRQARRKNQEKK